ncbi:MAG: glycoside hydrolase family 3 C-terminal domain-containing protein [Lachnospiraceae bacterium]|nr:glycoside hydrolase family 3 C-terminal domain-containing protein [Lachnospiraceae bacterium]
MKKQSTKLSRMLRKGSGILLSATMIATSFSSIQVSAGTLGGKYYSDFTSLDEALEAAGELNLEVAEEGNVLLKNDGTLPLTGSEYVSVFGISSAELVGATENTNSVGNADGVSERGAIYDSLTGAGFKVNGVLADFYSDLGGADNIGNEVTEFTAAVEDSLSLYNEAAIIVISRNAGEGADADTIIDEVEDNDYLGEDAGWEHEALFRGTYSDTVSECVYDETSETEYKHYLELTESEEDLIQYVEEHFGKVVVVLNTANAMEMYNLREDENINAILLMGRPGETGHMSVGEILAGEVNPSGKLVDEWNTDFTADPTWSNFGYGVQVGSENMYYYEDEDGNVVSKDDIEWGTHEQEGYYGVDYEEDIYLGYSYWETYYYEYYQSLIAEGYSEEDAAAEANDWWEKNVTFAFGYGLSYTTFSFNIDTDALYATGNDGTVSGFSLTESNLEELFASSEGSPAEVKTLYIPVTVTNTGSVSGKEVVEIYVTAPYSDSSCLEKSYVVLSGYEKTDELAPGESQTVYVKVNVQDFSSFDYNDANGNENLGYELEAGEYIIRAMDTSHYDVATDLEDTTDAYDEVRFTLDTTVALQLDDYSDNLATALFSDEIDEYTASTDEDHNTVYNSLRTAAYSADGESEEILLSRSNILTYKPEGPTSGDLTLKEEVIENWEYWNDFSADDTEEDAWYVDSIPSTWTQGTGVTDENGVYAITLADMMGIELYDDTTESGFSAEWDEFMNQLTVDELKTLVERQNSMWTTTALETIGKISSTQADSYNDVRTAGGTFLWVDSPTLSATWNTDLANKVGLLRGNIEVLNGWSGYGGKEMNTHRSPFSGRNAEYLSQDGIQGGYIAAALVSGMESKGVTCYIKHFAFNDMETCRDGMNNNVWVSEQAARQIYLKVFQMAMQEGGASGAMTGFARFCGTPMSMNNQVTVSLVADEWGWDGFFITDGYSGVSNCTTMETMLRAHVIPLPLGSSVPNVLGEWDGTLRDGMGNITIDGVESSTQYYYLRETAALILYADAKSNDVRNGFVLTTLTSTDSETTQGEAIEADLGLTAEELGESTAVYEITEGELPEGVTLSSDGILSGTPSEAGTYTFTVSCTIDGWVTPELVEGLTTTETLTVNSAFYVSSSADALDAAIVGEEYRTAITSDTFTVSDETTYTAVTYTLLEGDLESYGLTVNENGYITGTPTKSGSVDFTLQIEVTSETASEWGGSMASSDYYTYSGTIVISE